MEKSTDLVATIRGTGSVREFTDEPVDDAVLTRILDHARFAPNGGNRQAWHVVVMKDPALRTALRELYLGPWRDYFAQTAAGFTPWAPVGDRELEDKVVDAARASGDYDEIVRDRVEITFGAPIILAVFGDLERLVATDRDLGHYTMVAGASIYPFMWNILLASRSEGLGGVITTMHARVEPEVRELLNVPDNLSLAGVMMIGHPVHQPTKLRREPVANFATVDRFDGNPFGVDPL
jgi:nitroreductase